MSNGAKELAERIREAHARSLAAGLAAPAAFLAEEVELVRGQADDGVQSGAELAARYEHEGDELSAQMPGLRMTDVVVDARDDLVVLRALMRWNGEDEQKRVIPVRIVYTMRLGRIVRAEVSPPEAPPMPAEEVLALRKKLSNWGRWGAKDQRGTLNHISADAVSRGAACVRSGMAISCARPLATMPGPDNPTPVAHHMTGTATEGHGGDYFAMTTHGTTISHLDALCHIFDEGRIYNGYPAEVVTAHGAIELGIEHFKSGITTRGLLLDIPRVRGVEFLEPAQPIFPDDLDRALSTARLEVTPGDALLIRTGRWSWRDRYGPWDVFERAAGLDASCLEWLHESDISILACDGMSDVMPSRLVGKVSGQGSETVDVAALGLYMPIHTIAIAAMGLPLLDNLDLEELAATCASKGTWDFFFVVAPLILKGGTGSPVNPLAIF